MSNVINKKVIYLIILTCVFSFLTKLPFYLSNNFPLGDGGLFSEIIDAFRINFFQLPQFILFNGIKIPISYPPLAFYIGSFLCNAFDIQTLSLLTWFPLIVHLACTALTVILFRRWIKDDALLLFACLILPMTTRSFEWMIMGGGLTRIVGYFFTLTTVFLAYRLSDKSNMRNILLCGLSISASTLAHLEGGIAAATITGLILYQKYGYIKTLSYLIYIGLLTVLFTSPWWITIIIRHGIDPLFSASKTGGWHLSHFYYKAIYLPINAFKQGVISILALYGAIYSVLKKKYFFTVWTILFYLMIPRFGPNAAVIPYIILCTKGIEYLMDYIKGKSKRQNYIYHISLILIFMTSLPIQIKFHKRLSTYQLSKQDLEIMKWVKVNTPKHAKFVVLSPSKNWADDYWAEWFYYLTRRISLTTAQGFEWIPNNQFNKKLEEISRLKWIGKRRHYELNDLLEKHYPSHTHVVYFGQNNRSNFGGFLNSSQYRLLKWEPSGMVLERQGTIAKDEN